MEYKIKELMDWWKQFNKIDLKLITDNHEFQIGLSDKILPHLLGLQYTLIDRKGTSGLDLYFKCYGKSDEEIFDLVRTNNLSMLQSVYDRVETFQYFMENLENGVLVENTKESTNIRSQHFLVEYKDNKVLHLGLLEVAGEDVLVDFNVIDKKLETYFLTNNHKYFDKSIVNEKVKSIEKYNEYGDLVPFSFKQVGLEDIYEKIENEYSFDEGEATIDFVDIGQGSYNLVFSKKSNSFYIKDNEREEIVEEFKAPGLEEKEIMSWIHQQIDDPEEIVSQFIYQSIQREVEKGRVSEKVLELVKDDLSNVDEVLKMIQDGKIQERNYSL